MTGPQRVRAARQPNFLGCCGTKRLVAAGCFFPSLRPKAGHPGQDDAYRSARSPGASASTHTCARPAKQKLSRGRDELKGPGPFVRCNEERAGSCRV